MGEASHPGPPSTATTHEVVLRADFWEGIAEASEQAPSTAASCVFSQAEWVKAVDKTFPRPLTRLLNGEAVKLPSKLAEPWSAFQKLRPSARLGGRVRPNMSVAFGKHVTVWTREELVGIASKVCLVLCV